MVFRSSDIPSNNLLDSISSIFPISQRNGATTGIQMVEFSFGANARAAFLRIRRRAYVARNNRLVALEFRCGTGFHRIDRAIRHGSVSFGDARLYFITNFKYFDSIDTKLQLFPRHIETREGWTETIRSRKKKNKRTHFSRFIISLNLIRIKGKKKKKKILKNTFDRFKSKFEHWRQRCASKLAI